MRWPWSRRPEKRASFTDAIVAALVADASGAATRNAHATAALEGCAALYACAFARARFEPDIPAMGPACRALIARDLIRRGENIHLIEFDVGGGNLRLLPAGSWDLQGQADPSTWYVRVDLFGPSGNVTRFVPHEAVVHFRYAVHSDRPWYGVGPLQWAASTGALAGRLEAGLAAEAGASPAQLLAVPSDGGDGEEETDPLAPLKKDIREAAGRTILVETTAEGWGQGMAGAPRKDWEQTRIGAHWPDVLRASRKDLAEGIAVACGVPPGLLDPRTEGTGQREALRRFMHLSLEPMGELVAAELAYKLDMPGLTVDFSALMASDLAGKARAIKGLVDAGVGLEAAVTIAGLGD